MTAKFLVINLPKDGMCILDDWSQLWHWYGWCDFLG
jgi:hypothetical protein